MKAKKITALLLAAAMAMSALTGCGSAASSDNGNGKDTAAADGPVTLTFFDKNSGSNTFDDDIAKAIMEKTGVAIQVENPTGDPLEKLNLMLTGQNYPDIVLMDRGNDIVKRYIDAGALIPLNALIDQYGPHIKEMYGDVLTKSRYSDGKNYYLNNWYGVDPDASAGVLMRRDLLAEIVGKERAESPEPFTQSEYLDILRQFKEKFPEIDGKDTIALTLDAADKNYEGTLYGMYGMKWLYENGTGLQHRAKDPKYKDAVSFMNTMYTEGLLDKEWVVNKKEQWVQKLSSGSVFSTFGSYWDVDGANASLAASVGPDAQFYSYKVVADGVDPSETTYNGRSTLGWDAIGITDNCKNPEAAMKLIDFLVSEEGQYLMMWGIEGKHWDMVDGKHVPKPEIVEGFLKDPDKTKLETGIRKWTWFIKNGYGSDGTPYDMSTKYQLQPTAEFANQCFGESDAWDTADFTGIEPSGSTPQGLKWQKVQDIYDQNFPKIVNASSQEEALSSYDAMISEMDAAGLAEVEAFFTKEYQEKMKLWGEAE